MRRFIDRFLPARLRTAPPFVPVIRLQGAIAAGQGPMRQGLSLSTAAPLIERAFQYRDAAAVALIINSPGGSAVQSRLIHKRIRDLAEEKNKHVVAFVEDAAASGGYMIACAADEIVADPSSIVGSIGVVTASFGFPELMRKIGVERRVHTAGRNKAILDPFLPEKGDDIERLKQIQADAHAVFIDLVKARRGVRLKDDPDLFTGAFWTGQRALGLGLVDEIGDLRSVLRGRYGDKTVIKVIAPSRGIFGGRLGFSGRLAVAATSSLAETLEERAAWARLGL